MSQRMRDIHQGIVQCISATLNELKRSNSTVSIFIFPLATPFVHSLYIFQLDLEDFSVENTYFKSFDSIVRRQLDPVWHKVGPKTKQLVGDLGTLRRLLTYLLAFDPFTFHSYLETIVSSNSGSGSHPLAKAEKSDWLFTEAAHIMITSAKARCYTMDRRPPDAQADEDDEQWGILDEIEAQAPLKPAIAKEDLWKPWMPKQMNPILEEPGKWRALADVLLEIEQEIASRPLRLCGCPARLSQIFTEALAVEPGTNIVLVMVSDSRTALLLQDFLSSMRANSDAPGRPMMLRKLHGYLYWKSLLVRSHKQDADRNASGSGSNEGLSEAMKRKDQQRATAKQARRRVRGGGATVVVSERDRKKELERTGMMPSEVEMELEAEAIADL